MLSLAAQGTENLNVMQKSSDGIRADEVKYCFIRGLSFECDSCQPGWLFSKSLTRRFVADSEISLVIQVRGVCCDHARGPFWILQT